MEDFPVIETERLVLKQMTVSHLDSVFQHFADEEVNRYVDFDPVESIADAQEIIDWGISLYMNNNGILWGIFNKESGRFLGQVNFVNRASGNFTGNVHRAEIGFDLSPQYWRNGYMTEAIISSISWIFDTYKIGIRRIEAIINKNNQRAKTLVLNVGFTEEAVLREYVQWKDEFWDMSLFSLLKHEWEKV
ncbi:MAG: GNAT family protein [Candidatus Eisenbacteria bacterium]